MKRVAATALLAMGVLHGPVAASQNGRSDDGAGTPGAAAQAASEQARALDRVTVLARQDLAHKLRLNVENIRIVNAEPRRWTDDDMNCNSGGGSPPSAESSAQATGSAVGYRLALSASGRTYFYHTDLRSVRACPPLENQ